MEQRGPWKIKSSEVKYKNPWMEVREDQVVRPDGKDGIYGVINVIGGVSVLPIDDEGNVYLTDEFHYGIGRDSIEVISGGLDDGEDPLACAKRELVEETGITAKDFVYLGETDPFTSYLNAPVYLYLARNLSFGKNNLEGSEIIRVVKMTFEEAVQMVMESKISHGGSCVLILKAAKYLGRL